MLHVPLLSISVFGNVNLFIIMMVICKCGVVTLRVMNTLYQCANWFAEFCICFCILIVESVCMDIWVAILP